MNRTARSLLGAAVLAPLAAALAVASAPANAALGAAARADAAPGPSTALLYDTAAAAYPVTRRLPDPVLQSTGRTAETVTGTVDRTLGVAPATSGLRAGTARCKLNPGKTLNNETAAGLPEAPVPGVGAAALDGLPKGDCLGRRGDVLRKSALPVPGGATGALLRGAGQVAGALGGGEIGRLAGAAPALPAARRAGMPVSTALPAAAPAAVPADLPSVPSALGFAQPGDLPVSSMLFPARDRRATPLPSDDVLGQANDTVNTAGANLDRTEEGVGEVVDVLKAKDPAARPADGLLSDGPLSMPDVSSLALPALPGSG
ncbi:hypothetical protein [Actinomadura bangladeshensis]|uniref:ATP-binding protein n=1 Tax=Actinomadura bangladeshensis TaxID=453573 RepID=A0A4R4P625_9ACTN|nr:hypothetical protein [Actinomadura bangladeshensis]TDC17174.1 hypothetical protein E1284_10010 [Actinomadura bangladeshensis]